MDTFDDVTEPLKNGAKLPEHPALTTSKKIVEYGAVQDDATGTVLHGGLHNNEITMLMGGQQGSLSHLFRCAIRNRHIYHTRPLVVISVRTEDVDDLSEEPTLLS